MNLSSLNFTEGEVNPSGITQRIYYIPKTDIKTFPKYPSAPANAADEVTLSGDFILQTGKKWHKLYSTSGKGKVDFEGLGEKDAKMFTNKGLFKYPKLNDEAKAFAKIANNSNFVFIVALPLGKFVVIGSRDYDTESNITGGSGDVPGSEKGLNIEISCPDIVPLPSYVGDIILADGTLDCETDAFTPSGG